jgi:hypothetical protein
VPEATVRGMRRSGNEPKSVKMIEWISMTRSLC